eukprot:364557-Chlamydomonas_euryale.AAC.2
MAIPCNPPGSRGLYTAHPLFLTVPVDVAHHQACTTSACGKSAVAAATSGNAASSGVLGSFLGRLALRVTGSSSLTEEDLAPALDDMKKRLMERNVAEGIAAAVCASVGESLKGQKLASFTGVGALARKAFEEALSGILLKRQVDVLLDIKKAQVRFVLYEAFVGAGVRLMQVVYTAWLPGTCCQQGCLSILPGA